MYFPYLRGRQFELLALKELLQNGLIGEKIIPIIEPVKLSSTLNNTIKVYAELKRQIAIIMNPAVGNFMSDLQNATKESKQSVYKNTFFDFCRDKSILKSIIVSNDSDDILKMCQEMNIDLSQLLIICNQRDYMGKYDNILNVCTPKYTLIPDESGFRRKVRNQRVLLDDKFEKKKRNADYQKDTDEFFSEDHLYYREDGFVGFSDYSIVGDEYMESGFAPYAVAIHIVHFDEDKTLRIKHFVSESNEDITNPALKFYEAVSKLNKWCTSELDDIQLTVALKTFLQHHEQESYPGLGTVKKLSLMHHIELMSKYLNREL